MKSQLGTGKGNTLYTVKGLGVLVGFALPLGVGCARTNATAGDRMTHCDAALFRGEPPVSVDVLGPISVTCEDSTSDEECLRLLELEACRIGGDVVFDVVEKSRLDSGKLRWEGRAARVRR
jgi:hypothetical protein